MATFTFSSTEPVDRIHIVDYQTCNTCGFRLMRIESASGQSAPLVMHCAICGMHSDENNNIPGRRLTPQERVQSFDEWLALHGLTRMILEDIYRLRIDSFFDFLND